MALFFFIRTMLYGDLAPETADAYFHYGVAMLKLGRWGPQSLVL
jgi:hypothetical protein